MKELGGETLVLYIYVFLILYPSVLADSLFLLANSHTPQAITTGFLTYITEVICMEINFQLEQKGIK